MLILDLDLEHLARARQRGFQREAALQLMLKQARSQASDESAPKRRDELSPATRFLARLAANA